MLAQFNPLFKFLCLYDIVSKMQTGFNLGPVNFNYCQTHKNVNT